MNLQIQKQEALFYILKTGIGKGDVQNIFYPCCTLLIQSKLLVNVIFAKLGDQVKPWDAGDAIKVCVYRKKWKWSGIKNSLPITKIACRTEVLLKSYIENEASFWPRLFFLRITWYKMQKKWSGQILMYLEVLVA